MYTCVHKFSKIPGGSHNFTARRLIRNKCTENLQILSATVKCLAALAIGRLGFVHVCVYILVYPVPRTGNYDVESSLTDACLSTLYLETLYWILRYAFCLSETGYSFPWELLESYSRIVWKRHVWLKYVQNLKWTPVENRWVEEDYAWRLRPDGHKLCVIYTELFVNYCNALATTLMTIIMIVKVAVTNSV